MAIESNADVMGKTNKTFYGPPNSPKLGYQKSFPVVEANFG